MGKSTKPPCPYTPFGRPCLLTRGHGRPHKIQVEAAYVEAMLAKAKGEHVDE